MGQGGQGRQGNRAHTRSGVDFRRLSNRQYGNQDRAYMRLDMKRLGLAFGSPASRLGLMACQRGALAGVEICLLFFNFKGASPKGWPKGLV